MKTIYLSDDFEVLNDFEKRQTCVQGTSRIVVLNRSYRFVLNHRNRVEDYGRKKKVLTGLLSELLTRYRRKIIQKACRSGR